MKYAYAAMRECIYIPSYFHGYCRATKISIFEARATAYCEQFYIEIVEHVGIRPYGKSHGTIFILTIESNISDTRDLSSYNIMDKFLVVSQIRYYRIAAYNSNLVQKNATFGDNIHSRILFFYNQ